MSQLIALVTGGNKGIGYSTVQIFGENNYITYLAARNEAEGIKAREDLINELKKNNDSTKTTTVDIRFIKLDIDSTESIKEAVSLITKEHGKLDVLINNAGILLNYNNPSQYDPETLHKTFKTNFFSTVEVTQLFLPLLEKSTGKTIINVSSDLGSLQLANYTDYKFSKINVFAYNASKSALNSFTVSLSRELASKNFKIHSIAPGFVKTPMNNFAGELEPYQAAKTIFDSATKPNGTGRFLGSNNTEYPW